MTAENPPIAIQADSHSAEVLRRALASLLGGVTVGNPGGVVAPGDLAVSAGAGNSLNVAAGEAWIPGNAQAHMGAYYGYNDGVVNLGVTPNASNPLYAIVTASVNDQAYTGNPGVTNNTWNLLLTQGTAAPSPAVPATPANSLLLATVLVPANASSSASYTITDDRVFAGMPNALRNNPAGHMTQTAVTFFGTTWSLVTSMAADWVRGGMSFASNLFTAPVTGVYRVSGALNLTYASSTQYGVGLWYNGALDPNIVVTTPVIAPAAGAVVHFSDEAILHAGDTVGLAAWNAAGPFTTGTAVGQTHFACSLSSI